MGLHPPHVVAVQEPVQLLTAESHDFLLRAPGPVKLVPIETLVPDHKAVVLPFQQLEFVAPGVNAPLPGARPRTGGRASTRTATDLLRGLRGGLGSTPLRRSPA